ncbi:MAG TPA: hypothetical protein DIS66_07605 [Candidatus Omnitrophica bacterium]|nr:hypothetical protein [Candidatus Omnitrophota bacterium]
MKLSVLLSLIFCFALSGCAGKSSYLPADQVPAGNSQEILIEQPYDLVYLAVFDTVNDLTEWSPDKTLQTEGLIRLRNTQFSRFDDSDRRFIQVRIRRDGQFQTSVFLDPESRNIIGAAEVLDAIRKKFGVTA